MTPGLPDEPPRADTADAVVGGEIDRVSVTLRVGGEDLDPAAVTALLGLTPTAAARKGEPIGRLRRPARAGTWKYQLDGDPALALGDQIDALLGRLPADPAVWHTLHARYHADVFCGLFLDADNRETSLAPQTLARLAERGLPLSLDIYSAYNAP